MTIDGTPGLADLLGWLTLFLGLALVLALAPKNRRLRLILVTAFLARAGLALVHYYITPLPDSGGDAVGFESIGWEWSRGGLFEAIGHFETGAFLYSWCISLVYAVTERSPLMIQAFNVFFGTLIVYNVYRTSLLLWGAHIARRAAWLTALFPVLILYSAITLREVAIVYPLTLGALYLVRWHKSPRPLYLALALIGFAVSLAFHTGILGVFIALGGLLILKWVRSVPKPRAFARYTFALLLCAGALAAIVASEWGLYKLGGNIQALYDLERIQARQEVLTSGRTQYPEFLVTHSLEELAWKTPLRIVYLLFTPFPWMVRTALDALGLVNVALNLLLAGLVFRNIGRVRANPAAHTLFWILIALLLVFALNTSNYGTATRHAAKLLPLAVSLVVIPSLQKRSLAAPTLTHHIPDDQPQLPRRQDPTGAPGYPA
jgi:hypothetical protein